MLHIPNDQGFRTVVSSETEVEIYEDYTLAYNTLFNFLKKKRYSVALAVQVAHSLAIPYWDVLRIEPKDLYYSKFEKCFKLLIFPKQAPYPTVLSLNPYQSTAVSDFLRRKHRPKFYLGLRLIQAAIKKLGLFWDKEHTKLVTGFILPSDTEMVGEPIASLQTDKEILAAR